MTSSGIQIGMRVYGADGALLGRVVLHGEGRFLVRRGFFRPQKYTVRDNSVREIRSGAAHLSQTGAELTTERASGLAGHHRYGSDDDRTEAWTSERREDLRAERRLTDDGGHIQEHL